MATGEAVVLIFTAALTVICLRDGTAEAVREAIDRFRGGGPPAPMHPSPANDGLLLRRRHQRQSTW